ncbi:uncharacterized protein LOC111626304 [Centruroides sculpturatus]|uniref:uncharacterized protein LOC111626304 n=1 Tax=Centruroides sculpturatus TaxID=218467 RepID=UPI000C6E973A|nr:uncharacterized protein LOC111626304 [Centruroides sculpturatus]
MSLYEAMNSIKIAEDSEFLFDQRGERKTSIDKKLEKTNERSVKRKQRADELRENTAKSNASISVVLSQELELDFSFSSTSTADSTLKNKRDDYLVVVLPSKTLSCNYLSRLGVTMLITYKTKLRKKFGRG